MTAPSAALPAPRRRPALGRLALFALSAGAAVLPFLVVTFPPVADLPQHVAQARLLEEALADPGSPYRIQWLTPYGLVYALFALGRAVAGPIAGGRLAMAAITVAWVGALHLLAAQRGRPAAAATLASLLAFHHALYWGFASFLLGWPVFVGWLLWTGRERAARPLREGLGTFALAAFLYLTHALWFAAAVGWLAVDAAVRRRPVRELAARAAGVAPVAALAGAWFAGVGGTSFGTPPLWLAPLRRLDPRWLVEAAFGGLRSGMETLAFVAVLGWLLAAVLGGRRRPGRGWDRSLAILGLLFLAGALLLPDKYTNTIEFNTRWMPPALALLLLAAPPVPLGRRTAAALAAALLVGYSTFTAATWRRFERVELAGLEEALTALPEEPRLLGLDYVRHSRWIDNRPFLQTFAWGQALRGGELNFSFAEFPPSPVVYDPPRRTAWTGGLEWFPERVRTADLTHFDHLLVHAPPQLHRTIAGRDEVEAVTRGGAWRLYRVVGPAAVPAPGPPDAESDALTRRRSTAPPPPTAPGSPGTEGR